MPSGYMFTVLVIAGVLVFTLPEWAPRFAPTNPERTEFEGQWGRAGGSCAEQADAVIAIDAASISIPHAEHLVPMRYDVLRHRDESGRRVIIVETDKTRVTAQFTEVGSNRLRFDGLYHQPWKFRGRWIAIDDVAAPVGWRLHPGAILHRCSSNVKAGAIIPHRSG